MPNLRLALRTLWKTPFVTLVAVISLALGIGANAAIFSLFDQILLRPLPVAAPQELVNLAAPGPKPGSQSCNDAGSCEEVFSHPMFRDLEREQRAFTGIAAHFGFGANLAFKGQTMSGSGMLVSGSYFPVLGLKPALGRLIGPEDDRVVRSHFVAVLSHAYWQNRFGGRPDVVGETLIVNGQSMTILGVAPRGFKGTTLGSNPHVFVPITMRDVMIPGWEGFDKRRAYWAYLFARLRPEISIDKARQSVNVPYRAIINDVEAALQEGMSDPTLERFRARQVNPRAGRERTKLDAWRSARTAGAPSGGNGCRAPHRLRQHRELASHSRREPRHRIGGAVVNRCEPPSRRAAASDGVVLARYSRRARRFAHGTMDARARRLDSSARCARRRADEPRLACSRLRGGFVDRDRASLRAVSRDFQHAPGSGFGASSSVWSHVRGRGPRGVFVQHSRRRKWRSRWRFSLRRGFS